MIPDDENISAFAAYSSKTKKLTSRNQKRRLKSKEKKNESFKVDNIISNQENRKNFGQGEKSTLTKKKILVQKKVLSLDDKRANGSKISQNGKKNKKLKKRKLTKEAVSIIDSDSIKDLKHDLTRNCVNNIINPNLSLSENEDFSASGVLETSIEEPLGIDKPKKIKRKTSENICQKELKNKDHNSDVDHNTEPPKKMKKKVSIATPERNRDNGMKTKKPIVATPHAVKKKNVFNDFNKTLMLEIAPSKTLQKVDEYLVNKKELDLQLSAIGNTSTSMNKKTFKDIELAQLAKTEMLMKSSEVSGKCCLEKILEPVPIDSFMRDNWEKGPIHIPGQKSERFSKLISTERIDAILRDRIVSFGKHLDVTSYSNGKRETHNLDGRANAHVVWDFYSNGCSVRLLNPQYFFQSVHTLNATLQEYFGCFVGANSYLTPPMSQGFAPHYDDIEAFILQIEGSKIWKIYQPINNSGYLPRYSSRNLLDEEIGEPIMEVKLKAGDVLYFPRGFIHQGRTEEEHSLHLTLSVYQKTAWCDLLEKLLPLTLKKAASHDVEFRKGLPIGYLRSAGLVHKNAFSRKDIVKKIKKLVMRLNDFLETDAAIDQMGLSFVQDALPPVLTVAEAACTVSGDGWKMRAKGKLQGQVIITQDTKVRWIRAFCYRIIEEEVILEDASIEKQIRIYHTLENSKEYHAEEPQFLIANPYMLSSLRHLTTVYPDFIKVSELPCEDEDDKILFVSDLWDRGLLMTDSPLETLSSSKETEKNSEVLSSEELKILSDLEERIPKSNESDISSTDEEIEDISEEESETSVLSGDEESEIIPSDSEDV